MSLVLIKVVSMCRFIPIFGLPIKRPSGWIFCVALQQNWLNKWFVKNGVTITIYQILVSIERYIEFMITFSYRWHTHKISTTWLIIILVLFYSAICLLYSTAKPLTIFAKSFILDVWQGSECTSGFVYLIGKILSKIGSINDAKRHLTIWYISDRSKDIFAHLSF